RPANWRNWSGFRSRTRWTWKYRRSPAPCWPAFASASPPTPAWTRQRPSPTTTCATTACATTPTDAAMQPRAIPTEQEGMRWLALAASISAISVVGIAIGLGTPLLSVILETRGHSATMIGANAAVGGVAAIVAAPFAIPLASRLGVVGAMLLMFVVGALSFVGLYVFEVFWVWFPLRATLHIA